MGELLLHSILAGDLSQKLPFVNKPLPSLKQPAITMSKLLGTKNVFIEQTVKGETHDEQPTPKKHKKLLLEKCQVVLDLPLSMNVKEKQLLRRKILDNGGTISYVVTRKSDIVISVGQGLNSLKQKMARKYGIPVVIQSYIDKCIEEQQLLDTKEFLFSSGLKSNSFSKGKIIADTVTDTMVHAKHKAVPLASLTCHPCEELHGYTLIKAVLLKDRSVYKAGTNKRIRFCVLELHTFTGEKNINWDKQFCVFIDEGYLDKEQSGNVISRKKQCYYLETADDALSVYSQLYFSKIGQPHCMIEANEMLHPLLGTPEFQKLQLEWSGTLVHADKKVLCLVIVVWLEAIGHLNKFLAVSPEVIPLWKVDEAEGILLQISTIWSRDKWEEMAERLSAEFYSILPHHPEYAQPIVTKKVLSQKQDLCQVLRDMVSVSEASGWSSFGHLQAKYRALRCHIENLIPQTEEYEKVKKLLIDSQHHATGIEIQEIYGVHRYLEAAEFTHHLPNKQLLFHATSPSNLVGILSQGLNLPKVVVQERGIDRFDIGMLGSGIYFTNSLSTCIKYSKESKEKGTRFLLVSEVALGNIYETTKFDTSLTAPPNGFNSIHGVKATESAPSDFVDDEFVIYSPYQQCMHYLVEFTLPEDHIKPFYPVEDEIDMEDNKKDSNHDIYTLDIKDTKEKQKAKQTSGLKGKNAAEAVDIPLKEVHVRAKLLDLVAQVVVFQEYKNLNNSPLECKYVFPLESSAAVCGFEAFINNKHVIGKIKRKEVAHKEYKEAISKGHGAYLMDEESPDVFTVSVGNIPPQATVIIKITYILELPVNDEVINFNIPTSVAPWIEHQAVHQVTQDVTDSVAFEGGCKYSILVSVEMPFPIDEISSPTHDILMKGTETMAVVRMNDPKMDSSDGFSLFIRLKEIHVPRMWTEYHEHKDSSQASMLVFYPEFEVTQSYCNEVIIVLDASNSMKGDAFQSALQVAVLCLMEIPNSCFFNVVAFGTVFQELFPCSHKCNPSNIKKAKDFLKNVMPSFGNTELFRLLRYYNFTSGKMMKNVIIISDGHINNEGTVLRNVKIHCSKVRLFTFGISSTANKHLLCQLACWGGGAFEYMDPKDKINWESKVKAQMNRVMQTALENVRIEWQNFADNTEFLQAPQQIMSIFNGCRQVIYGFIPDCTMAKLVAEIDGKEYETVVSSSSLNDLQGTMLHTLAARAVIRDWEDGLLAVDRVSNLAERKLKEEQIVELSKEYNLVTSITSFIAVEERSSSEESATNRNLLTELLEENYFSFDQLYYMEYEPLAKGKTKSYAREVGEQRREYASLSCDVAKDEEICGYYEEPVDGKSHSRSSPLEASSIEGSEGSKDNSSPPLERERLIRLEGSEGSKDNSSPPLERERLIRLEDFEVWEANSSPPIEREEEIIQFKKRLKKKRMDFRCVATMVETPETKSTVDELEDTWTPNTESRDERLEGLLSHTPSSANNIRTFSAYARRSAPPRYSRYQLSSDTTSSSEVALEESEKEAEPVGFCESTPHLESFTFDEIKIPRRQKRPLLGARNFKAGRHYASQKTTQLLNHNLQGTEDQRWQNMSRSSPASKQDIFVSMKCSSFDIQPACASSNTEFGYSSPLLHHVDLCSAEYHASPMDLTIFDNSQRGFGSNLSQNEDSTFSCAPAPPPPPTFREVPSVVSTVQAAGQKPHSGSSLFDAANLFHSSSSACLTNQGQESLKQLSTASSSIDDTDSFSLRGFGRDRIQNRYFSYGGPAPPSHPLFGEVPSEVFTAQTADQQSHGGLSLFGAASFFPISSSTHASTCLIDQEQMSSKQFQTEPPSMGDTNATPHFPAISPEKCRKQQQHIDTFGRAAVDLQSASFSDSAHSSPFKGVPLTLFKAQAAKQPFTTPSRFGVGNSSITSSSTQTSFEMAGSPLQVSSTTIKRSFNPLIRPPTLRQGITLSFENTTSTSEMEGQLSFTAGTAANVTTGVLSHLQNFFPMENNKIGFKYAMLSHPTQLQNVESVLKFLKDLLKCKGSLPLCNAVQRHTYAIALRNDNTEVKKLMDGTIELCDLLPDDNIDITSWNFPLKDTEDIKTYKAIINKILTNNYCEDMDCLQIGIMEPFGETLEANGLKSLGNKTALDIRRMLATLAAIMYFVCCLLRIIKEEVSGQHNFQKLENLSQLLAACLVCHFPRTAPLIVAIQFVRNVEQRHSLVYKSLNCGSNWEDFIIDYVTEPSAKQRRFSWKQILNSPDYSACYVAAE